MDNSVGTEVRLLSKLKFRSGVSDIVNSLIKYLLWGALLAFSMVILSLIMIGAQPIDKTVFGLAMTLIAVILSAYFAWGIYAITLARVHFVHLISGKMLYYLNPTQDELKRRDARSGIEGRDLNDAYDNSQFTHADFNMPWQRGKVVSLTECVASLQNFEKALLYLVMMGFWKYAGFHLLNIRGGNEFYYRMKNNHFDWVLIPKCSSYLEPWSEKPKATDMAPSAASRDLSNAECFVGLSILLCFWLGSLYLCAGIGLLIISSPFIVQRVLQAYRRYVRTLEASVRKQIRTGEVKAV